MPSVPSKFLALRIHEEDEKPQAKLEQISLEAVSYTHLTLADE